HAVLNGEDLSWIAVLAMLIEERVPALQVLAIKEGDPAVLFRFSARVVCRHECYQQPRGHNGSQKPKRSVFHSNPLVDKQCDFVLYLETLETTAPARGSPFWPSLAR